MAYSSSREMAIHSRDDHHEHGHKTRRRTPASLSHMRLRTMQRGTEENRTQICFLLSPPLSGLLPQLHTLQGRRELWRDAERERGRKKERGRRTSFSFLPIFGTEARRQCLPPFPPSLLPLYTVRVRRKQGWREEEEASERLHAGRRTVNRKKMEVRDSAIGRQKTSQVERSGQHIELPIIKSRTMATFGNIG